MAFNAYVSDRAKQDEKQEAESMRILRFRPESDTAGLCLERESYSE